MRQNQSVDPVQLWDGQGACDNLRLGFIREDDFEGRFYRLAFQANQGFAAPPRKFVTPLMVRLGSRVENCCISIP